MKKSTRTVTKTLATIFSAGTIATALLVGGTAFAQEDDDDVPPPEVVATLVPVYHEGHAAYWWHNRWHYREGVRWRRWHTEPEALRTRHAVVVYHNYYHRR